jgi:hypothetical protein
MKKKICFKPKNRVKCNENFKKVKYLSTYKMVKFNFGLGGSDDDKKDDGQTPQTDDSSTGQTSDPVVTEPSNTEENNTSSEIQINEESPTVKIEGTPAISNNESTEEEPSTLEENSNDISETPSAELEKKQSSLVTEEGSTETTPAIVTDENKENETISSQKDSTQADTTNAPFTQKDEEINPFPLDTEEKSDPFSIEDSDLNSVNPVVENTEKPFGDLIGQENTETTAPVVENNEKAVSEDPFEDNTGDDAVTPTATNDPLQTLNQLKEEIENFVSAKRKRIIELNKEISDRKKEIKEEEKSLADKQKEFSTMLADIQKLTGEFDKKKEGKKK